MRWYFAFSIACVSVGAAAEEPLDESFARALAMYPQCVVSEAIRLDDRTEPAETVALAAMASCREVRAERVETTRIFLLHKTPEMPRTERYNALTLKKAEALTVEFDILLKDRALLEILEKRKVKR